jgi:hypothetical protein
LQRQQIAIQANMSDSVFSSSTQPRAWRVLRIPLSDVPALFSEGPEPEARMPAKCRHPHIETMKRQAKKAWPAFISQLSHRSKTFWLGHLQA